MALLPAIVPVWSLAREIEELLGLQKEVREALGDIGDRVRAIEDRVTRIEAERPMLVTEARSAACIAASAMSGAAMNDVVTRLTRVEIRLEHLEKTASGGVRVAIPGDGPAGSGHET